MNNKPIDDIHINLQTYSHYSIDSLNDSESLAAYRKSQIDRHSKKINHKRHERVYRSASRHIFNFKKNRIHKSNFNMWCLGTRNNWERNQFRKFLKTNKVFSLDISPNSNADLICDFNILKLKPKAEVIYSNSIDHSIDATMTYLNWIENLKKYGIMVVDFPISKKTKDSPNSHDCSLFSRDSVLSFLQLLEKELLINMIIDPYSSNDEDTHTCNYYRTIIKKLRNF